MRYARLAVFLFFVFTGGTQAQSPRTLSEVDPGLTVAVDLNRALRLDFATGREKTDELSAAKWKVAAGVSFRIKPFRKTLFDLIDTDRQHRFVIGAMYEYSRASEADVTHIEHRIMLDGTFRNSLPAKFLLTHRSRFEFRFLDHDFHWRYRDRLMIERRLKAGKIKFTPFGAAEAVWDRRYTKFTIFKFTGGVTFPLIRRSTLDVLYERQHCVVCSDPNTNIIGVTLNLYLRRKK
jgi:hypothetical protein